MATSQPSQRSFAFWLGVLTPLLPAFGSGYLLLAAIIFLLIQLLQNRLPPPTWVMPFLFVSFASALVEVFLAIDVPTFEILWKGLDGPGPQGLLNIVEFMSHSTPSWLYSSESFLRLLSFFLLVSFFSSQNQEREKYFSGTTIGLSIAALITAFLITTPGALVLPNQNSYWTAINRVSGTFTDPNAFGIYLILALPLLAIQTARAAGFKRWILGMLVAIWTVLAFFCGSRSFFLGLGLYALWFAYLRSKVLFFSTIAALLLLAIAMNIFAWISPPHFHLLVDQSPEGLKRLIETFSVTSFREAFFSRFAFWTIGCSIWLDNFFFGVGFENFRQYVPSYASELGLGIGTWSDNSNNFYLGILAELGCLGGLAFALSLGLVKFKSQAKDLSWSRPVVIVFAILLSLGPHLSFDEVALLFSAILGSACDFRSFRFKPSMALALAPLILAYALNGSQRERGFYNWEKNQQHFLRWTSRTAKGQLFCDANNKAHLKLRAIHPELGKRLITALVTVAENNTQTVEFSNSEPRTLEFPCPQNAVNASAKNKVIFIINVDPIWTPRKFGLGSDSRLLGLQVLSETLDNA